MLLFTWSLLLTTISEIDLGTADSGVVKDADLLFQDYWEFTVSSNPELATQVGDHRFNDKLNSYALTHYENAQLKLSELLNRAKQLLATAEPGSDAHTNLEVLSVEIQYKLNLLNIKSYLFPVSYLDGPPLDLFYMLDYVPMASMKDFNNLVSRYRAFPQQVDEIIELLKEGIRTKMVLNERSLKNFENQTLSFVTAPKESKFYEPFKKASQFIPPEKLDNHLNTAAESINQSLNPAIQKLADFVENTYRKHLRPDIAVSSIPNGQEYYQQALNFYISTEVAPEAIHNLGLREVARISKEMDEVIRSFGLNISKQEFNEQLRKNESNFFKTQEEALNTYIDVLRNKIEPVLPMFFKNLPKAKLQVKKVPEQLAGGPMAYYMPASPDGLVNGTFFLDVWNLKDLPKYETVTLALHEGEPGHHFQMSYTNEQEGVPMFRKRSQYPINAAFTEGWALYSEFLGMEMGLYHDKLMLYGHLSEEIFRACRLVVDTGIHTLGWSRQQAIEYMLYNSAGAKGSIQNEIDRYITWPGQACSYKYGEMKIKEFRSKAETVLGSKFNHKDFHDVVLRSSGSMSFVGEQVDRYIKNSL